MISASKLTGGAWYTIAKELILVGRIATIIIAIAQPSPCYAHIRIRTFDIKDAAATTSTRCVADLGRTTDLVRAIAVLTIDDAIATTRQGDTLEIATLKLCFGIALWIHTVCLVAVVAALINAIASFRLRQAASVAAAELRGQTGVKGAKVVRFVTVVRTMSYTVAY
jgi:hypothetical protein